MLLRQLLAKRGAVPDAVLRSGVRAQWPTATHAQLDAALGCCLRYGWVVLDGSGQRAWRLTRDGREALLRPSAVDARAEAAAGLRRDPGDARG